MNKARRKQLQSIIIQLNDVTTEEQEAYDNLPESIQDSAKGQEMQENIDSLEEATGLLEEIFR